MRIHTAVIIAAIVVGSLAAFLLVSPNSQASSYINDRIGDAVAIETHETNYQPLVQPYHDIVSSSLKRLNAKELLLTAELKGDPNLNTTYETVYMWLIDYPTVGGNQRYTIIVPHFPPEMGLTVGWHIAIFDNNAQQYIVPLKQIGSMPNNRVEVNLGPSLIGSPPFFWWQVFVMVRTDTDFSKPPDFLMDSAPDNYDVLLWPFT